MLPDKTDGLFVGGETWGGLPPAGTTLSFDYTGITHIDVESDYEHFTDDPWDPEWDPESDWPRHKQENVDPITINGTVHPPGTLQLENEYEVQLMGDDGESYRLVAISAVRVNPNHQGDWDYLTSDEYGVIGFTFQGPWPPEGTVLTFVENVDGEQIDWDNFVPPEEIPCFTSGTMILTDRGEVMIDDLRVGDLVATRDHGLQPIRWIGSRTLGLPVLIVKPNLRPIRIAAGALGAGLPVQDLLVSPQHRMLVRSKTTQRMVDNAEALVPAKQLLNVEGFDIADTLNTVKYFHLMFDAHEIITANGAETESLYPGPQALKSLGPDAVAEIHALFPELLDAKAEPAPARQLLSGRMARKLAIRHAQNNKALVTV
ncbi:hemolysin-type calcium-binding region (plasmid) [Ketogulonicigenium robustum]|uniref:Hemolysin-type calcium-binding region n=1 Tax=Ketogulonicigenium robustum TaxID=92947 RepID=A0A1W6P371_9RHOB|nr:Hint domain-containing protein [Ketogulonicigenium robustum]ARO15863.1 hemolysin-type calcium-binding region [Ketogulonicigenium robustum]